MSNCKQVMKYWKKLGLLAATSAMMQPAFADQHDEVAAKMLLTPHAPSVVPFTDTHPTFGKLIARPWLKVWKPIKWAGHKTYIIPATKCIYEGAVWIGQKSEPAQPFLNLVVSGTNAATTMGVWARGGR